jgi:hypothetical protein
MPSKSADLKDLLDRLEEAAEERPRLSFSAMLDAVGRRSFGPILLLAGLIVLAPLVGDIPGVPTTIGVFVLLTVGQILFGRKHIWLPKWMLKRSVTRGKMKKVLGWARKPAKFVDRLTRPRLDAMVQPPMSHVVASMSMVVALGMPFMEVVPFSANAAGAILALTGLSLIAEDGLLALIAMVITALTAVLVVVVLT